MTERRLAGALLFVLIALGLILLRLMPVSPGRVAMPGPDLLLALAMAWVLRRPSHLPALLIAAVFLTEDILLGRPLGLGALTALAVTESLRQREARLRDGGFVVEWAQVALVLALALAGARLALAAVLPPPELAVAPPLWMVSLRWLATVAAYPVVVIGARMLLGLRRATPAEREHARMGTAGR